MRHLHQSRIHRRVKVVFAEGGAMQQAQCLHQFGGGFRPFLKGGKQPPLPGQLPSRRFR